MSPAKTANATHPVSGDESLRHIFRTSNELRAELGTQPVSLEAVRNPAVYELERERIFKRVWLKVATVGEIPNVGDYKVKELPVADTAVIIVRSDEARIRAFHNVCTHRGNKVVPTTGFETHGHARANVLSCRFHGWVFGIDGALRSVPLENQFAELDTGCLGLREISCDTWESFVFINLDRTPSQSLSEYLGDFGKLFRGYPYAESTAVYHYSTVLECNWKVALYAFSEAYHVPTIHAGSLPGFKGVEHTNFKLMGAHASSTIYGAGMDVTPATREFAGVLHGSERHRRRPDQLPPDIRSGWREGFQFEYPNLFPNFLLHLSAGCGYPGLAFFTHQFWPIDHRHTLWEGINYFPPPANAAEKVAQLHINALHRNAWLEDTATMENTFAGIRSGAISTMQLMDQEFMIRHAVRTLDRYLVD